MSVPTSSKVDGIYLPASSVATDSVTAGAAVSVTAGVASAEV